MKQEITLSRNIVSFLFNNPPTQFKINNSQKCCEIIEQNILIFDKKNKLLEIITEELNKLGKPNEIQEFKAALLHFLSQKAKKYEHRYINRNEFEIELANESKDKIYLEPDLEGEKKEQLEQKYENVEIHNTKTILKPKHYNRLKNIPTNISLDASQKYDLELILNPFLKNSTMIIIIDPFLPNPKALSNLIKTFGIVNKNVDITLRTFDQNIYLTYISDKTKGLKQYQNFSDKISNLNKSGYNITIEFIPKGHIERYIITENYKIYIPGGFDCLDEKGKPSVKPGNISSITISFNKKNSILNYLPY